MKNTEFFRHLEIEASGIGVANADTLEVKLSEDYKPEKILIPQNVEQLITIVKLANKYKMPIYPIGSGTGFCRGVAPFQKGVLVSLQKIAKLIEYRPDNMSIEVEAGMSIAGLQEILAKDNIFFPIDTNNNSSTIGGLVARNAFGRKKHLYKTTRFYVLGMEFISPGGELIKVGGRTIKNVSSYDLHQLLAGSWGAFGIITKVTLRVKPLPEKNTVLECLAKDVAEVLKLIETILFKEKTNLASLVFEQKSGSDFLLQAELEGFAETLKQQQEILQEKYDFKETKKLLNEWDGENAVITIPLKSYIKGLGQLLELGKKYPDLKLRGNATSGLIYVKLKKDDELLQSITTIVDALEGNFIFENAGLIKKDTGTGYADILKKIKNKIDPNNILVPTSRVIKE